MEPVPRSLLPLSVADQIALLAELPTAQDDGELGQGRAVAALILSTGMHPCVISQPLKYLYTADGHYYSYRRAKTRKPITGSWSSMLADHGPDGLTLAAWLMEHKSGRTTRWYNHVTALAGEAAGILGRLGPLRLRHTHFVDLARLGYDPYTIAHRTGTSPDTIWSYYSVGMAEMKRLTEHERTWLDWLLEA
jgi:hypothetical protein